jgi:hypothetical protein
MEACMAQTLKQSRHPLSRSLGLAQTAMDLLQPKEMLPWCFQLFCPPESERPNAKAIWRGSESLRLRAVDFSLWGSA